MKPHLRRQSRSVPRGLGSVVATDHRATEGVAQRRGGVARRRRLRPVRLLWLRHRDADLRPPRGGRTALQQLPHDRAVLAHPRVSAERPQPSLQRHGPHRRSRRRASPATTRRSRRRTASSPRSCSDEGYATFAVGKWHLAPATEMTMGSPRDKWPLGRGFERFYGFMGGETDQYYPDLVHDNHNVAPPRTPEEGYHLTEDLADHAHAVHQGPARHLARQAVPLVVRAGRLSRAPSGAGRLHRGVPRSVRRRVGCVARARLRQASRYRAAPRRHRAERAPVVGAGVVHAQRGRT